MVPTREKYRSSVKAFAPVKFLERNSDRGIIGSRERPSTTRKAPNATTPVIRAPITRASPRPALEDSRSPKTTPPRPTATSAAPGRSSPRASGLLLSGTRQRAIASTATAIGTLMKNTARQETFSAK
jgi:hypothetical protein